MKQKILLLSTLICINAHANHVGSVHIINDTDQSLRAEIEVPDHSRADITITKIDAERTLHQAILHDSSEEIKKMNAFIKKTTYLRHSHSMQPWKAPTYEVVINVPYGTGEFRKKLNKLICSSRGKIHTTGGGRGGPIALVYVTSTPFELQKAFEKVNQKLLPLEILKKYAHLNHEEAKKSFSIYS